jgi:sugar phosphate isomerase/epimerase
MLTPALCAFGFNDGWGLDGSLRLTRDLGFTVADVSAGQLGGQDAIAADPAAAAARLRTAASAAGVRLEEFVVFAIRLEGAARLGLDTDPALRAAVSARWEKLCACAAAAGCRSILGAIGHLDPALGPERSFELVTTAARDWADIAWHHGLVFTAEVDADGWFGTPESAAKFIAAVNHPAFGLTLDFAHWVSRDRALADCFYLLAWARHFHVKQARPGYLKTLWHRGTIDFAALLTELRARDWSGVLAIETAGYHVAGHPWPAYAEVRHPYAPEPPVPGLLSHPVHQTVLHAQVFADLPLASLTPPAAPAA